MKAPIAQLCSEIQAPSKPLKVCAIGAFIGLHGQNAFKKLGFGLGSHSAATRNFNLNMILKIEF